MEVIYFHPLLNIIVKQNFSTFTSTFSCLWNPKVAIFSRCSSPVWIGKISRGKNIRLESHETIFFDIYESPRKAFIHLKIQDMEWGMENRLCKGINRKFCVHWSYYVEFVAEVEFLDVFVSGKNTFSWGWNRLKLFMIAKFDDQLHGL